MAYLIGADEAGYGPNLGPLVVAATLWQVPDLDHFDLNSALKPLVSTSPKSSGLVICDSKKIHQPQHSLAPLEHHCLAALGGCSTFANQAFDRIWTREFLPAIPPSRPSQLAMDFAATQSKTREPSPSKIDRCHDPITKSTTLNHERFYFLPDSISLPLAADPFQISALTDRWNQQLEQAQITLVDVQFCLLFPQSFNGWCQRLSSKGAVLSYVTLQLVKNLLHQTSGKAVQIVCDKHGGRDDYRGWLQSVFLPNKLTLHEQSELVSRYTWDESERAVAIDFRAKGESFMPTALASMTAKYLREVIMERWNYFWKTQIVDLKPTKGYPSDAKRFANDIRERQSQLGLKDELIWRAK